MSLWTALLWLADAVEYSPAVFEFFLAEVLRA
jgi:hypothetical protein